MAEHQTKARQPLRRLDRTPESLCEAIAALIRERDQLKAQLDEAGPLLESGWPPVPKAIVKNVEPSPDPANEVPATGRAIVAQVAAQLGDVQGTLDALVAKAPWGRLDEVRRSEDDLELALVSERLLYSVIGTALDHPGDTERLPPAPSPRADESEYRSRLSNWAGLVAEIERIAHDHPTVFIDAERDAAQQLAEVLMSADVLDALFLEGCDKISAADQVVAKIAGTSEKSIARARKKLGWKGTVYGRGAARKQR